MQKIATKVFIGASIAFFINGMLMVLTTTPNSNGPNVVLIKIMFAIVIVILTSFALSIASKYLK